jgi:hypothetical protein
VAIFQVLKNKVSFGFIRKVYILIRAAVLEVIGKDVIEVADVEGTYLVVVEVRDKGGRVQMYSARLGVRR